MLSVVEYKIFVFGGFAEVDSAVDSRVMFVI